MDKQGSLFTKLADGLTSMVGAAKAGQGGDFGKAMEQLEKVGDESGYKQAMKMANEEKMKHLDDMQRQRDMRRDAILQCIEFTERIKSCQDDDALADAAIKALHSSIGALKSPSAIMMNAALFWRQMESSERRYATDGGKSYEVPRRKTTEGLDIDGIQNKSCAVLFQVGCSG